LPQLPAQVKTSDIPRPEPLEIFVQALVRRPEELRERVNCGVQGRCNFTLLELDAQADRRINVLGLQEAVREAAIDVRQRNAGV
jgi:hypothetical protein